MTVKINDKILSITPFISTSWSQIVSLRMKENSLMVTLLDGETLSIPDLSNDDIRLIFQYHAAFLEKHKGVDTIVANSVNEGVVEGDKASTLHFSVGSSLDSLGTMMQHNPSQFDAPNLPTEVLQKISTISKIIGPTDWDESVLPTAEPHCNCFHCQIARILNPTSSEILPNTLHEVDSADLQFQEWDVEQVGEQLFVVTNRLNIQESYRVYLGQPLGCTCGAQKCEHILAVLKT